MNILILEDEEPAADRLTKLLLEAEPTAKILETLVSVKSALAWFKVNPSPDLILMDINLADGLSFEIFSHIQIEAPVIFITAYDQYAVQAFKVNSVEYLLKPIKKDELQNAINKYKKYFLGKHMPELKSLLETLNKKPEIFKKRFLIKYGDHIKSIDISNVAYFYTEDKINFLKTKEDHSYHIDYNLDKLETIINPERFFRINRQFIISIDSISEMYSFSKSRVKVILNPPTTLDTIVSTERSPNFKEWLSGQE